MSTHSGIQRSGELRVSYRRPVTVIARGHRVGCNAVQLSASGLLVIPGVSASPGLELQVELILPGCAGLVSVSGVLVREVQVAGQYAWEVQFTRVSSKVSELLMHYVQRAAASTQDARSEGDSRQPGQSGMAAPASAAWRQRDTTSQPSAPRDRPLTAGSNPAAGHPGPGVDDDPSRRRTTSGSYARVGTGSREAARFSATGPAFRTVGAASAPPPRSERSITALRPDIASALEARRRSDGGSTTPRRETRSRRSSHTPNEIRELYRLAVAGVSDRPKKK